MQIHTSMKLATACSQAKIRGITERSQRHQQHFTDIPRAFEDLRTWVMSGQLVAAEMSIVRDDGTVSYLTYKR